MIPWNIYCTPKFQQKKLDGLKIQKSSYSLEVVIYRPWQCSSLMSNNACLLRITDNIKHCNNSEIALSPRNILNITKRNKSSGR